MARSRSLAPWRALSVSLALAPSLALSLALALSGFARADVAVGSPPRPRTPLGAGCDRALARAQEAFEKSANAIRFHVRERTVVGVYEWSDQCGVWGTYTVEIAPDRRAATAWQWTRRPQADDGSRPARLEGTRRGAGLRVRIHAEGDSLGYPMDSFADAFVPALDACVNGAGF